MTSRATIVGACVQGLVLGILLTMALAELLRIAGGDRIFRYQGF